MDKLADKGWADMEKKLDASMPVENKKTRRIFPILIFMLFFIAAGSAVIYWLYTPVQDEQTPEKQLPETSVDYAIQNVDKPALNDQVKFGEIIESQKNLTINDFKATQKQGSIVSGSSIKLLNNANKAVARSNKNHSLNKKITPLKNVEINSVSSEYEDITMEPKAVYLNEGFAAKSVMNPVSEVNTLEMKYFEPIFSVDLMSMEKEKMGLPLSFNKFDHQNTCDHGLTVQSGMISENLASFGGFEVGLGYKRYFPGHFYFSSALIYKVLDKNYFSNALMRTGIFNISGVKTAGNATDWVEERYTYELQNAEIRNNAIGYEYVLGLVNQLHYLEIPIQIGYQWKRLGLYGGINVSWMIFGSNAVRDLSEQYFNTVVLSDEVLFNKQMLNRFDLSPQLGLEYKLWHGLSVYSYYNHGLIHIANAESASEFKNAEFSDNKAAASSVRIDRNRYFSLGIKYDLPLCSIR